MCEDITIAPVSSESGDWLGFERVVDVEDEEEIEQACSDLEQHLKGL